MQDRKSAAAEAVIAAFVRTSSPRSGLHRTLRSTAVRQTHRRRQSIGGAGRYRHNIWWLAETTV